MQKFSFKSFVLTCCLATGLSAEPMQFATPQEALETMMTALKEGDGAALKVFGEASRDFLSDGDPAEDAANRQALLELYREGYRLVPQEDGAVLIALGVDGWPFPIPVARTGDTWAFDIETGRAEVEAREIGLNELDVVELLRAYVDVQALFRSQDRDGDGVMEFASTIISSSPEMRDGLFWPGPDALFGELFARASAEGFSDGETDHAPEPYAGYYFRILTSQSDAAPGGAMEYQINGNMLGGHALLAVPAIYGETGIHSFMVSENGVVLEAVLGEDTLDLAAEMTAYDPTADWSPVQ
ncbi:MAG: DUF2950 family protein [Paracoccaceae bacterium]|nr:DUF2950 family protein [Paracoccaceae bacterium]